jgi:DNA-binding NarL/FixJ family response regulator
LKVLISDIYIIADNQDISKAGIRYFLEKKNFKGRYFEARDKKELIHLLASCDKASVVLDYTNFDFNNIEELLIVSQRFNSVHWILFSDELTLPFLKRILLETNFSVLLKSASAQEIEQALTIGVKEQYICDRAKQFIYTSKEQTKTETLTSSEKEILKSIALGKSVKEIAEERFSSVHTITTHKKNIFKKLDVNTTHEASKWALRSGLIDVMDYYI